MAHVYTHVSLRVHTVNLHPMAHGHIHFDPCGLSDFLPPSTFILPHLPSWPHGTQTAINDPPQEAPLD